MTSYLLRRLIAAVGVIFGISLITFVMIYLMPGDPARLYAGPRAPEATVQNIRQQWGLNDPLLTQYLRYVERALHGDLGRSPRDGRAVLPAIIERLPATLQLAIAGLAVELALGIPLGILAAARPGSWADALATSGSLVAISIPPFVLGVLLLYVFGFLIPIFPLGGYGTPLHLILPALTLGLGGSAWYARLLRNNLLDELGNDYIRTARSKGVHEWDIYFRHALRNAMLPVITLAGLDLAILLGGVVVVEAVFGWPGIGQQAWRAIRDQNIPIIMGTVLLSAICIVFINLIVDLLYLVFNPRIRLEGSL
ncbi:MAG: ABC transporter permease [Chloroflexota bacterium]